jgi:NAD-dependent dihydropyrimidine dehydrogenase PreA subunit
LDRFRPRGTPRKSKRSRWRAAALIAVHVAVLVHVAHWKIAGSTVTPVEPSEAMKTLELGYINAGFLLFCALLLLTLVLGRFFCGWACHVVAYQDLCAAVLARLALKPRPVRSRLLVWVPFGAAFYMFAWPTIERWIAGGATPAWSWHLTTTSFWETFPGPGIAALTILIDGFLIVYWLGAKGFCTYGCPYGAMFGLAERVAPLRIRVTDACEGCGHCTAVCTSNVRVHEEVARFRMVVDPGCMKCMDCVSVCPNDALYYGFGPPALGKRRPARFDFGIGEEIGMALVFFGALFSFRSLYGLVPFLLALGLSVLVAVFAITAWRLVRRPDVSFQTRDLKRAGRLTPLGRAAAAGLLAVFGLTAHSAFVQYHTRTGDDLAQSSASPGLAPAEREARLAAGLAHLDTAARWGLRGDPRVLQTSGLVLREMGRYDDAERSFRRALELQPGWPAASIPLTDLLAMRGAFDEAAAILRELLAADPHLAPARQRLALLEQGRRADPGSKR